jgi:hypothetical protein
VQVVETLGVKMKAVIALLITTLILEACATVAGPTTLVITLVNCSSNNLVEPEVWCGEQCRWYTVTRKGDVLMTTATIKHTPPNTATIRWHRADGKEQISTVDLSNVLPQNQTGGLIFAVFDGAITATFVGTNFEEGPAGPTPDIRPILQRAKELIDSPKKLPLSTPASITPTAAALIAPPSGAGGR